MSAPGRLEAGAAPRPGRGEPGAQARTRSGIRRSSAALSLLALSGCLMRQEMGVEPVAADAGCVADCAEAGLGDADALHERLRRLLNELAQGPWVGHMESGDLRVPVTFEFRLDGTYTVRCEAEGCQVLFPSLVRGVLHGHYEISAEVLQDAFFGAFEDPLRTITLRSELSFLTLQGDRLTFERRLLTRSLVDTDFIALLARADLTRRR